MLDQQESHTSDLNSETRRLTVEWPCDSGRQLRQMGSMLQIDPAEDLPWSMGQAGEHPGCGKTERVMLEPESKQSRMV